MTSSSRIRSEAFICEEQFVEMMMRSATHRMRRKELPVCVKFAILSARYVQLLRMYTRMPKYRQLLFISTRKQLSSVTEVMYSSSEKYKHEI